MHMTGVGGDGQNSVGAWVDITGAYVGMGERDNIRRQPHVSAVYALRGLL